MSDIAGGLHVDSHVGLLRAVREAADRLEIGVCILNMADPERVLYVSEYAATIFGRRRGELEGGSPWVILAPEREAEERARFAARGRGEAPPISFETDVLRPDGTRIPVVFAMTRVVTSDGPLTVAFLRDVSARVAALETLRQSEARFRSLVEGAPDGIVILERGRITFMNELAANLLGFASPAAALGTSITQHLPDEDAALAGERIARMFATGVSHEPHEYRVKGHPDRVVEIKSILIDRDGTPAVLAFARDVSSRKQVERELLRADRLASVGMLSAAVAHEINNPLTYVQLCLQFLERELPATVEGELRARVLEQLHNARQGVGRVATIVRDLRTFARADDEAPGPVDVVACVERALKLADNDLRHRARLVREFAAVSTVRGNASRLEQVFLNLLINAAQALPDGDPARDEIRVSVCADGDERVVVTVSDSGEGITAAARERAFEPFFTTKPIGEGTGLGLSVCRSIVEQAGGSIAIDAVVPHGTSVRVGLPVFRGASERAAPVAATAAKTSPVRLRVLVVDDEPLVRRVLAVVLSRHHEVVLAEHGRAALDAIATGERFDAVVCDMMMPEMNGMELHGQVAASDPDLSRRFVFITGGALVPKIQAFLERVSVATLYKPFEVEQVLVHVAAAAAR